MKSTFAITLITVDLFFKEMPVQKFETFQNQNKNYTVDYLKHNFEAHRATTH
jgi:hypothetical protein